MIVDDALQNQLKILQKAAQFLDECFQQIEQLDVFCTLAKQLNEEIKSRTTYDFIYEIAVLENKNVIEQINNYKHQLFTMHEQIKVNQIKTQNNNINNKETLQFIEYLKQQVKDKLELSQKYEKLREDYERYYLHEDLGKLKEIGKQNQNPSQEMQNTDKLIGNISQICHQCNRYYGEDYSEIILKQDIKQNQFDFIQLQLGDNYQNKEDIKSAKSAYKLEIKQNPENPQGYKKLGECLISQKRFMKAISCYEDFKGTEQEEITFQILKAKAFQKNDKLKEARILLFNLLQKYPQNKDIRDELGNMNNIYDKRGF